MATTYITENTRIYRGDGGGSEVFTEIPGVTAISELGQSRGLIDVTNLRSSAREYRGALKDGQQIGLTIQYDPDDATQAALKTDLNNDTRRNFKVELSNSPPEIWTFTALVMGWSISAGIDAVYVLTVSLKPTGDITITN
jgi:hypothetical protein